MANRKGQMQKVLLVAIVAVMVAVALGSFVMKFVVVAGVKGDTAACTTSINKLRLLQKATIGFVWSTMDCKYKPLEITGSTLKAKRTIAKELTNCWQKSSGQYGHETFDKFGDNWNVCLVCGKFQLQGDELRMSTKEMGDFLDEPIAGDEKITYAKLLDTDWAVDRGNKQFFLGVEGTIGSPKLVELDYINPDEDYYVMYTYYDNRNLYELFRSVPDIEYYFVSQRDGAINSNIARMKPSTELVHRFLRDTSTTLTNRPHTQSGDFHHTFVIPAKNMDLWPQCHLFYNQQKK